MLTNQSYLYQGLMALITMDIDVFIISIPNSVDDDDRVRYESESDGDDDSSESDVGDVEKTLDRTETQVVTELAASLQVQTTDSNKKLHVCCCTFLKKLLITISKSSHSSKTSS